MYNKVDEADPNVPFYKSKYFKQAHYLKGSMGKTKLKLLDKG